MEKPLVTITGPSGVGKTTIVQLLYIIAPFTYTELVSTTTRNPRAGEVEGVAYHFVTVSDFQARSDAELFLEMIEYNGTYYGIEFSEIEKAHSSGLTPLIVVEPHGAQQIRTRYRGRLIQIFLSANEDDLRRWMLGRGDEPVKAEERIALDRTAITQGDFPWDHVIANDNTIPSLCKKVLEAIT
jgi:guanylate kinase